MSNIEQHAESVAWRPSADTVADLSFAAYRRILLHETDEIRAFLDDHNNAGKFMIAAPKGFGKTLLLIAKRLQLNERSSELLSGGELVERLDGTFRTVSKERTNEFAQDFEFWQRMWSYSISLAAINESSRKKRTDGVIEGVQIPSLIQDRLDSFTIGLLRDGARFAKPTKIFPLLLNADVRTREKAINSLGWLGPLLDDVQSQVAFFIDNVDEYFSPVLENLSFDDLEDVDLQKSNAIWTNAQLALCLAAYNIRRTRRHIAVFCTVRQEAFLRLNSVTDNASSVRGVSVQISYGANDLLAIFQKNVEMMSPDSLFAGREQDPMGKFFGSAAAGMRHQLFNQSERPFDFVLRHTSFRPRDLMTICGKLADIPVAERTADNIREVVIKQTKTLVSDLFGEMTPFFRLPDRDTLFSLVNRNWLTKSDLHAITRRYIEAVEPTLSKLQVEEEDYSHPFCVLYQIGLLGFVEASTKAQIADTQKFKMPDEVKLNGDTGLPTTQGYYLIHPALDQEIFDAVGEPYTQNFYRAAIIGANLAWNEPKTAVFVAKGDVCGFSTVMETEYYESMALKIHDWARSTCGDLDFVEVTNGDSITLIDRSAEKLLNSIEQLLKRAESNDDHKLSFRFGVSAGPILYESVGRRIEGRWEEIDLPLGAALRTSARLEPYAPAGGILADDVFLAALGQTSANVCINQVSADELPALTLHEPPNVFLLSKGANDPPIKSRLHRVTTNFSAEG